MPFSLYSFFLDFRKRQQSQLLRELTCQNDRAHGFTLLELMIATAIIATLAAIAVPNLIKSREKTKISIAMTEIRMLEKAILNFELDNNRLPVNLAELNSSNISDPWGNPYQYLPVEGTPPGQLRKDRFMVPVNSDFDLYSKGPDGKSRPPFTAQSSRDDIVRANNGSYVGVTSDY